MSQVIFDFILPIFLLQTTFFGLKTNFLGQKYIAFYKNGSFRRKSVDLEVAIQLNGTFFGCL